MAPSAVEVETVTLPVHSSFKGGLDTPQGDYKEITTARYSDEVEKKGIEGHAPASVSISITLNPNPRVLALATRHLVHACTPPYTHVRVTLNPEMYPVPGTSLPLLHKPT